MLACTDAPLKIFAFLVSFVAKHSWYNRDSDCWPQLRADRDHPLLISLSTSIQGTVGDR